MACLLKVSEEENYVGKTSLPSVLKLQSLRIWSCVHQFCFVLFSERHLVLHLSFPLPDHHHSHSLHPKFIPNTRVDRWDLFHHKKWKIKNITGDSQNIVKSWSSTWDGPVAGKLFTGKADTKILAAWEHQAAEERICKYQVWW